MKTIKQLSQGKNPVGIFFHVDKKATVITTVQAGEFKRGDVANDKNGHMICRAVYDPADGDPAYEVKYEVTKLIGGEPKPRKAVEETPPAEDEEPPAADEADD